MKKVMLIVGALIVTSIFLSGCAETESETDSWTWELTEGWNDNIVFTQTQINKAGGTAIEVVFDSVLDYITIISYYDDDYYGEGEGQWTSWVNGAPHNSLETITANEVYRVYTTQDCTLTI